MANKKIPEKDKQLVLRRLAEGMSTRDAIEGTVIKSNSTASVLYRRESNTIERYRQELLQNLDNTGYASSDDVAYQLSQMLHATKTMRVTLPADAGKLIPLQRRDVFIEVEDWNTRLNAIKMILRVKGVKV